MGEEVALGKNGDEHAWCCVQNEPASLDWDVHVLMGMGCWICSKFSWP